MKSLNTILTGLIAIIALIGAILYIMILTNKSTGNEMIIAGQILVIVTAAIALFFGLKNLATNPAVLKKSLIALAVLAIVGILSYVSASEAQVGKIPIDEGTSKLVGTGIYMFYFLAAIAVITMVGFGIKKSLNK
jgi:hypothetical protein